MTKKLILVGCTTQNNKWVNGQSMMFQLFVDKLTEENVETVIVDFGKSIRFDYTSKRVSGQFSYTKLIDNFILTFRYLYVIISNLGTPVYITTSQSKVGFIRDYLFINIAKFFGSKVITHQFGSNYQEFYHSQSQTFKHKISSSLSKADKIVVEGDYTKEQFNFLTDYREKVISIPNGLPEEVKSEAISPKTLNDQEPVKIIYLSNLIESKGYWDVLKAVELLVNRDKLNIQAIFSGKFMAGVDDQMYSSSEQARKEFFDFIKKKNLENNITYYEGLYGENKAKAFSEAHFFTLPSYYINEGQPVSIVEALAYGCVPVVTEYRLIPDMVNRENGLFVNPKSPEEIAAIINRMIENPVEYNKLSRAGITSYLNNFTADKYIQRLVRLFW